MDANLKWWFYETDAYTKHLVLMILILKIDIIAKQKLNQKCLLYNSNIIQTSLYGKMEKFY